MRVWRESFDTFIVHAPAILLFGLIGFAGASSLCTALSAALGLHFYGYASGPFVTRTGLSALNAPPFGIFDGRAVSVHTLLLLQAALGLFAMSFARGVIAHIALQRDDDKPARLRDACRVALVRLPALLVGSLIYGGLITLGVLGLNLLLRELNLDLSVAGERARWPGAVPNVIVLRTMNTLMSDPGSPFAEFIPYWRSTTFRPSLTSDATVFWAIVIGSVALVILAETLFRFRAVMALEPVRSQRPHRFDLLRPLIECVHLGLRHFGQVMVHVCLLRLAVIAVAVTFLILPIALVETLATPQVMRLMYASATLPPTGPLISMSVAFVGAILPAFGAVYDARLYLALSRGSAPR